MRSPLRRRRLAADERSDEIADVVVLPGEVRERARVAARRVIPVHTLGAGALERADQHA